MFFILSFCGSLVARAFDRRQRRTGAIWGWAAALLFYWAVSLPSLGLAQAPAKPLSRSTSAFPAASPDLILERAYWFDEDGRSTLEQARQQRWAPYEGVLNRGYTDGANWVRLRLAATDTPLALRLSPAWLDSITLYDPADPDTPHEVGDRLGRELNAFQGLGFSFELPASDQPREVWLRLQSTSAHRLDVQALSAQMLPEAASRALLWAALYTAVLLLMFVLLLAGWLTLRDRVLGTFLIRHASFTVFAVSYLGLPALVWGGVFSPAFFDKAFSIATLCTLSLGVWFDITFLSTYRPNRHLIVALQVLAVAALCVLLLFLAGYERLALQWNVKLIALAALLEMVAAVSAKPDTSVDRLLPKRLMVCYYALIVGGLLGGTLGILGWTQPDGMGIYLLILHGLMSGLFMMTMLFVRNSRQLEQSRQMNWQLKQAQDTASQEQRRRQEQSQFLHMLMHELKTPLSVVSMALGTRNNREHNLQLAGRAVQDMKAVIERCVQADLTAKIVLDQRPEPMAVGAEVARLAEFLPGLTERLQLRQSGSVEVHTDRQLLQTILNNLLDNAQRYGEPLTPISVKVAAEPRQGLGGVAVRVANTPGLAGWPDPERLFSKYYRANGALRESGSGLGLFLAHQLATTLGGTLQYRPAETLVQFELWIPLTPS